MLKVFLGLIFFALGFFAWIFKPRYGFFGEPIIPFSPLQIGIPAAGIFAISYILLSSRVLMFGLMKPALSSRLLKLGVSLVIAGASVHIRPDENGVEAIMFVFRWLLPLFTLAFFVFGRLCGVSPRPMFAGFLAGALLSAAAVELSRRGIVLPVSQTTVGRFGAFLNHPNQYGILISTTAPVIVFFLHQPGWRAKLAGVCGLPLYCLCLFQAQSKTNIVLFVVALALSFFILSLHDVRRFFKALLTVAAGFILLGFAGVFGLEMMKEVAPNDARIIEDVLLDPGGARSVEDREGVWEEAIAAIRSHPVWGIGPGRTLEFLPLPHAHNLLLQLYLDAGILGFGGICAVVLSAFCKNLENLRHALGLRGEPDPETMMRLLSGVSVVIYVLANAMSDSFNTATMSTFVLFVALTYGAEVHSENEAADEEAEITVESAHEFQPQLG